MELYLGMPELEFYVIFMCHTILLIFFQPFENVKLILSSEATQKGAHLLTCLLGLAIPKPPAPLQVIPLLSSPWAWVSGSLSLMTCDTVSEG